MPIAEDNVQECVRRLEAGKQGWQPCQSKGEEGQGQEINPVFRLCVSGQPAPKQWCEHVPLGQKWLLLQRLRVILEIEIEVKMAYSKFVRGHILKSNRRYACSLFLNRFHSSLDCCMHYLRCTGILSVQFCCRTGYRIRLRYFKQRIVAVNKLYFTDGAGFRLMCILFRSWMYKGAEGLTSLLLLAALN